MFCLSDNVKGKPHQERRERKDEIWIFDRGADKTKIRAVSNKAKLGRGQREERGKELQWQ